ncbi:MAG: carbohydrate binding domain-containing protein [Fimbriimonadaceae bacterium]|nr:carbohydrate binding domain-containing protein [Fimbriimonadaceae bacterium]
MRAWLWLPLTALAAGGEVVVSVAPLPTAPLVRQEALVSLRNAGAERVQGRVELTLKPPVEVARTARVGLDLAAGATVEVRLPFELYEEGAHPVTVRVVTAAGEAGVWQGSVTPVGLATAQLPVANYYRQQGAVPPRPAGAVVTGVDPQNRLIHRGQPWVPIGIYLTPTTERGAKELAAAGFDLVSLGQMPPVATRKYLDLMQSWDLKVWTPLSWSLQFAEGDVGRKKAELTELVAAVGGHPALALWESIDEPAWGGQPAWGLREGYQFLRALDPQRPIWTNHAPRNSVQTLQWYNQATDLAGCDVYPVPMPQTQSNLPNPTLSVVGDEARKSVATVSGQKPILMVLQGFAWATLSQRDDPQAVYPTFAESRFMAYDAITAGANGILYWGCHYTPRPSPFWSDLKALVSELRALAPALASLPPAGGPVEVAPADSPIAVAARTYEAQPVLLLANRSGQPAQAKVRLPGATTAWRALSDDAAPPQTGGALQVSLPPWGTLALTTHPTWTPRRPDYRAEGQIAKTLRPLPLEPGNLLPNGSFEQDDQEPGQPDGWQARFPFTSELDRTVTHHGGASLKLTSDAADFRPLLVQTGIAVQRDAKYELTGWLRSDTPGVKARFYVEWVSDGHYYGGILPWTSPTATWQRFTVPVSTTPNTSGDLYAVVQIEGVGTVWFDDLRLVAVP